MKFCSVRPLPESSTARLIGFAISSTSIETEDSPA